MKFLKNVLFILIIATAIFTVTSCDKNKDELQEKELTNNQKNELLLLGTWRVITDVTNEKATTEYIDTSVEDLIEYRSHTFTEYTNDRLIFFSDRIEDDLLIERASNEHIRGPFDSKEWNVDGDKLISATTGESSYTIENDGYSYNSKSHVIIKELTEDKLILEYIVLAIHRYENEKFDFNKITVNSTTAYTYTR